MAKKTFSFKAPLEHLEGHLIKAAIYIPDHIMAELPKARVRAKGKINETDFSLAIQFRKTARSFFMISEGTKRNAGLKFGDIAKVSFVLVNPEVVELPEELEAALEQDAEAAKVWKNITPGLQRSLCVYINSVKSVDSRISRALHIVSKVKAGDYTRKLQTTRNKND